MNHSKQRDTIMEYLMSVKTHPTASDIYEHVRTIQPQISRGTVYRNLAQLAESGTILKLTFTDGMDHYDADVSDHLHFICSNCNSVLDLPDSNMIKFKSSVKASEDFDGRIEGHFGYFYGICGNCLRKI